MSSNESSEKGLANLTARAKVSFQKFAQRKRKKTLSPPLLFVQWSETEKSKPRSLVSQYISQSKTYSPLNCHSFQGNFEIELLRLLLLPLPAKRRSRDSNNAFFLLLSVIYFSFDSFLSSLYRRKKYICSHLAQKKKFFFVA